MGPDKPGCAVALQVEQQRTIPDILHSSGKEIDDNSLRLNIPLVSASSRMFKYNDIKSQCLDNL